MYKKKRGEEECASRERETERIDKERVVLFRQFKTRGKCVEVISVILGVPETVSSVSLIRRLSPGVCRWDGKIRLNGKGLV